MTTWSAQFQLLGLEKHLLHGGGQREAVWIEALQPSSLLPCHPEPPVSSEQGRTLGRFLKEPFSGGVDCSYYWQM